VGAAGAPPNLARPLARRAHGAHRAGSHAAPSRRAGRRQLRGPRRLQAPGPVERGKGRSPRGRRVGQRRDPEGAPPGGQHSPQDRQPHGRGPRRGLARGRRRPLGLRDRQDARAKTPVGRAAPRARPALGEGLGLASRSRAPLAHAGCRALGLRPGGAAPARRRHRAAPAHHARDGRVPRHLSRRRPLDARSAPPRPPKRLAGTRPTGCLSPGPQRERDRRAVRRDRARALRAFVRGLLRTGRLRAPRPRSPPASAPGPTRTF
jgi:hypothetical protein